MLAFSLLPHVPQSMPWQDDPHGVLHRLFWNESPDDPEEGVFRTLGVVHLFASSGIHVYAFLSAMESLFYPLARRLGLDLRWTKRIALGVGLLILAWAWALQSYRLGFARPILTFLIRKWGHARGARFRVLAPLVLTLLLDLCFDLGGGRLHYYLAIMGGLLALERLDNRSDDPPSGLKVHVALALGSWVLTAPIDLVLHHRVAWMTPVYSLLTLPVLSYFLYPVSLLSLFVDGILSPGLIQVWTHFMAALLWLADHAPGPITTTGAAMWVAGAVAAMMVLLIPANDKKFRFGIALAALLIRFILPEPATLTQLDVKQGDGMLFHTDRLTEMVDVGPDRSLKSADWIERESFYDVRKIDTILLSHLDADHISGLERLLPWIQVDCIETHHEHWKSDKGLRLAAFLREYYPAIRISEGGCFRSGTVAWFGSESHGHSGNEWMAGVVIPLAPDRVYLGLGDGDQSQERAYLRQFWPMITAYPHRIWKLGHHGSKYSSDPEFLEQLHPEKLWLSVGRKNPYHHPHPNTLQRLAQLHSAFQFQRTDVDGDLTEKISQPSRFSTVW